MVHEAAAKSDLIAWMSKQRLPLLSPRDLQQMVEDLILGQQAL